MYKVGYAWRPGELEGSDYWTLDIDYEQKPDKDALQSHGAIMQVHGETLSACLFRAKLICHLLNDENVHNEESFVQLLELSKAISIQRMKYDEKENAED